MRYHFTWKFPASAVALSTFLTMGITGCDSSTRADEPMVNPANTTGTLPDGFVQLPADSLAWLTVEPVNGQAALASGLMWSYGRVEIRQEQQIALPAPVAGRVTALHVSCLLYTSDAADE